MTRHKSPRYRRRAAHAPYNFVSLPAEVFSVSDHPEWIVDHQSDSRKLWQCHDQWVEGKHSGWVDLDITTRTPLYVRCGVSPEQAEGDDPRDNPARRHFFHHGNVDEPWIPGSTLKGMTRSLMEIMSRGKFQPVSDRRMFYRGVGDRSSLGDLYRAKFLDDLAPGKVEYPSKEIHGGYLIRDGEGWAIRPARRHHDESFVHVAYSAATPIIRGWGRHQVHPVWVQPVPRTESPGHGSRQDITLSMALAAHPTQISAAPATGLEKGFLIESGHMGKSVYDERRPNVIPRSPEKHMHCVIYEQNEDAPLIPISDEQWRIYQEDCGIQRDANRTPRRIVENEPLFYRLDDSGALDFFGPTMMFRLPYRNSLVDRIPAGTDALDLAEAMFGSVGKAAVIKGRLFFESARWKREAGNAPFYEDLGGLRSPKILGAPKPTAFQMYLEQPNPEYARDLEHWDSERVSVRGWKRYWHRKAQDQAPGHEDSPFEEQLKADSTQHTIIRPVTPGTRFSSRVRFENLNAIELGALLMVLDLPKSRCHQIGMGKPRGMGSVRIESTLHLLRRSRAPDGTATDATRPKVRYERMLNDDGTFHSGEFDQRDAAVTGTACREAFERAIAGSGDQLWRMPHLRELASMLEWDGAPHLSKTRYMELDAAPPNDDGHAKWWRERPVLPFASDITQTFLGDTPPSRREHRPEQREKPSHERKSGSAEVGTQPAGTGPRVAVAGETAVWSSVRVTLTAEPRLIIRAARPGGGPPAEATEDELAGFTDIAGRLSAAPGKSLIARSVTIQRRVRLLPLILRIEW